MIPEAQLTALRSRGVPDEIIADGWIKRKYHFSDEHIFEVTFCETGRCIDRLYSIGVHCLRIANSGSEIQEQSVKTKLTVSIDRDLLPRAKRSARRRGLSLSSVVERALTQLTQEDGASFSEKWRGRFRVREDIGDDPRGRELAARYLGNARVVLLIDTDALRDVALARAPFAGPAGRLLDHLQANPGAGVIAWHSIDNLRFLRSPRSDC